MCGTEWGEEQLRLCENWRALSAETMASSQLDTWWEEGGQTTDPNVQDKVPTIRTTPSATTALRPLPSLGSANYARSGKRKGPGGDVAGLSPHAGPTRQNPPSRRSARDFQLLENRQIFEKVAVAAIAVDVDEANRCRNPRYVRGP